MSISHKYKLAYIHIPKNGGTSIKRMFPDIFDTIINTPYTDTVKDGKVIKGYGQSVIEQCNNYNIFTMIRNPWDRFVSGWKYMGHRYSFEHFAKTFNHFELLTKDDEDIIAEDLCLTWHMSPQTAHIYDRKGRLIPTDIGKLEEIDKFIPMIIEKYKLPDRPLKHLNSTHHKHYTEYYNNQTRKIIAEVFKDDIELGNYKFGD